MNFNQRSTGLALGVYGPMTFAFVHSSMAFSYHGWRGLFAMVSLMALMWGSISLNDYGRELDQRRKIMEKNNLSLWT